MEPLEVVSVPPSHADDRGAIYNLLDDVPLETVIFVTSEPGTVRGNHYHETQTQWVFPVEGAFDVYFRDTRTQDDPPTDVRRLEPETAMKIPAGVPHAFEIEQYTEFIEVGDTPVGPDAERYEADTVDVEDLTRR